MGEVIDLPRAVQIGLISGVLLQRIEELEQLRDRAIALRAYIIALKKDMVERPERRKEMASFVLELRMISIVISLKQVEVKEMSGKLQSVVDRLAWEVQYSKTVSDLPS